METGDIHGERNNFAGSLKNLGGDKLKTGKKMTPNVENMVEVIQYKIDQKEISKDKIYVLVDFNDKTINVLKTFIVTLRYRSISIFIR